MDSDRTRATRQAGKTRRSGGPQRPPSPPGALAPGEGLRARKRRALRATLVAVAGRRFSEAGYDATNVRDVADAAGIAYQTLYNHFPSKAHLAFAYLETLSLETHEAAIALWRAHAADADPVDLLIRGADLYVELVTRTDRALWRAAMAEYMRTPEAFDEEARTLARVFLDELAGILAEGVEAGRLRAGVDPQVLAATLYVLVDHAIMRFVAAPDMDGATLLAQLHAQFELVLRPLVPAPR